MRIITLLTDFGYKSSYVAQMKGVISSLTDAKIIDISHDVQPQNIREAAYILQSTVAYYPMGTTHIAVIDPGVGTQRKGIFITTKTHILIGPDNGVLMPTAHFLGDYTVYEITNPKYMLQKPSNTFHGRDIFAPVAAYITKGASFDEIGTPINNYIDLDFGTGNIDSKSATGKIIHIDSFGNIITNINGYQLKEVLNYGTQTMAFIGEKQQKIPFVKSYGYTKKGELLATIGSSNLLEISINQDNAAKKLKVKPDDEIKILFS